MADGVIAVYDREEHVGDVRWTGVMSRGTWRFVPRAALPDRREEALRETVEGLPRRYPALKALTFPLQRGGEQAGWTGFAGTLGALRIALPNVGLRVEDAATRWVRTVGRAQGDEVRLQDPAVAAARQAVLDQWEVLALQEEARRNV